MKTDDPRITAYALGEMEAGEREHFEAELKQSRELREGVDDVRELAALLREEFSAVNGEEGLDEARRERVLEWPVAEGRERMVEDDRVVVAAEFRHRRRRRRWVAAWSAAAAVALIGVFVMQQVRWMDGRQPGDAEIVVVTAPSDDLSVFDGKSVMRAGRGVADEQRGGGRAADAVDWMYDVDGEVLRRAVPATASEEKAAAMDALVVAEAGSGASRAPGVRGPSDLELALDADAVSMRGVTGEDARLGDSMHFGAMAPHPEPAAGSALGKRLEVAGKKASGSGAERYARLIDNPFLDTAGHELPTFSVDVDTASYANVRRYIQNGSLPPREAVRIEELVNYFDYDYAAPGAGHPFSVSMEVTDCPWHAEHQLLRIGLQGRELDERERPPANLVFLVDVSGSMGAPDKLPLLKKSFRRVVNRLTGRDTVSMVTYREDARVVLKPTGGGEKDVILDAFDDLEASGSTNGSAGLELAYALAREGLDPEGTNRVLLATDGDFNVGTTGDGRLARQVKKSAGDRIYLSVLGFGTGNLNDSMLEKISNDGNGNYHYIDSVDEGKKVFVREMSGTLFTIAKDVKVQVDFNPDHVSHYRLIGYANRVMDKRGFADDRKDAGEIGAGHTVTALFEIVPVRFPVELASAPVSRYRKGSAAAGKKQKSLRARGRTSQDDNRGGELLTLGLRYKDPEAPATAGSKLIEVPFRAGEVREWQEASEDFRFAAGVAAYGMLLRESPYRAEASYAGILEWIEGSAGDSEGRRGFVELVTRTEKLDTRK